MPGHISTRQQRLSTLINLMNFRDVLQLEQPLDLDDYAEQFEADASLILEVLRTRYLSERVSVPRNGNLGLIYRYAETPAQYKHFVQMVRVTPTCFAHILGLIENNHIFQNNSSNQPQVPVETQLAVALYRFGHYGNGASIADVARVAGAGDGTVHLYTERVIKALLYIHQDIIRPLTDQERLAEQQWVRSRNQCPSFAPGIFQYDGSTITLWQKPGLNGDAYYSRHGLYEMNAQVSGLHM